MKYLKISFSLLICVVMIFASLVFTSAEGGYIIGDADGDGHITIADVTAIQMRLARIEMPFFNEKAADIDGDGLNISDATNIQLYLARYGNPYHIGNSSEDSTSPSLEEYELPIMRR